MVFKIKSNRQIAVQQRIRFQEGLEMITSNAASSPLAAWLNDEAVYINLKQKIDRTLSFCESCREAWEAEDLDEMIRMRDRLAGDWRKRS
jgi:hypothetical protein